MILGSEPRELTVQILHDIYHVTENDISAPSISPKQKAQFWTTSKGSLSTKVPSSSLVEQHTTHTKFPYADLSMWINPFALVSSESEFNHDPSSALEPANVSPFVSCNNFFAIVKAFVVTSWVRQVNNRRYYLSYKTFVCGIIST